MNEAIINPISEESPCGMDYKYEDAFLELEQEIDKDNSASEDISTDWGLVVSETERILSEESKDIKLLSWWIFGLWHRNGIAALPEALDALGTLIATHKSEIFPKSPRAKINVLNSLDAFLSEKLLDEKSGLQHFGQLQALLDAFEKTVQAIQEGFETQENFFRKIREQIARFIKDAEARAAKKEKEAAAKAESGEITSDGEANQALNPMKKTIQSLNDYWRGSDPSDMRALKMTRLLSWLDIDALPEADGGKVGLNPPSFEAMEGIEALEAEGKIAQALTMCENLMNYAPFWIDGHVKSYELLMAMDATNSANYVLQSLVAFVQTHKGILDLSYADGTPFASLASKDLIFASMPSGGGGGGSGDNDPVVLAKDGALGLIKKKKLKEGMQLVEDAYKDAADEELRFKMRLLHAELAVDAGQLEAAQALLDDLCEQIKRFSVDLWKPSLAASVYALYLGNFNRTQLDHEQYELLYRSLCKVDIGQALSIN